MTLYVEEEPIVVHLESFTGLREIRFDVQKPIPDGIGRHTPEDWNTSFNTWMKTAVAILQTLGKYQHLEKATILLHKCEAGDKGRYVEFYRYLDE